MASPVFLRFEYHGKDDAESFRPMGIFAVRSLVRGELTEVESLALDYLSEWFNINLDRPTRFSYKKRRASAICWFKETAQDHIAQVRKMVKIFSRHDFPIEVVKTSNPGYIVYEDRFQVAAVPFRDK